MGGFNSTFNLHIFQLLYQVLGAVPNTQITIGIIFTLMFHDFLGSLARSKYWALFSLPLIFTLWSTIWPGFFFFFFFSIIIPRSGLLARIRQSVCISKSQGILYISFSKTHSDLCMYHLVVWWNFSFLHNSQWITFPAQSGLDVYSLCAILLHLLIMW